MRFNGIAVLAGAMLLAACGGGESKPADTAAAAPEAAPVAAAPAGAAVAAAPVTGKIHTVNMVGDEKGYRYEPNSLTVAVGDGVEFVMISGGPHNVTFDAATVP